MTIARTWRVTERIEPMAKRADATALLEPNTRVQPAIEAQVPESGTSSPPKAAENIASQPETTALSVLIEAPMGHCEPGYATRHVDFRSMTRRQAAAAKRLFISLGRENARIGVNGPSHPDGKVVNTTGEAIRWIFDQLADRWESETGLDITDGLAF